MANFLFWNTNGNNIPGIIAQACAENEVDVLILAEFRFGRTLLLWELRERSGRTYLAPFETSANLTFITRYPLDCLIAVYDESGVAARRIRPPVGREILIIAMHLPSRLHSSVDEQALNAVRKSRTIDELEERTGHSNSLIIGDLNMDPSITGWSRLTHCMESWIDQSPEKCPASLADKNEGFSTIPCGAVTEMARQALREPTFTAEGKSVIFGICSIKYCCAPLCSTTIRMATCRSLKSSASTTS